MIELTRVMSVLKTFPEASRHEAVLGWIDGCILKNLPPENIALMRSELVRFAESHPENCDLVVQTIQVIDGHMMLANLEKQKQ